LFLAGLDKTFLKAQSSMFYWVLALRAKLVLYEGPT